MKFELSKEYVELLQEAISSQDSSFIVESLEDVNHADISTLLYEFNSEDSKFVVDLLDKERGARIISDLEDDTRIKFLKHFSSNEIARFIEYLDSDDAVDILNELSVQQREEIIGVLEDAEVASNIKELLH